ncbi:GAF domain-containing sensor histidine kinase [Isoptericola dokdonensis]|uniref:Redox sensor histidine kinase response regulator DevS n=1 Tax=Isoptericola dokdonensis DS-3 TaxID=1300344 RepID=A0A168ECT0_9MICO|nr:GAF domain-containing sensor histidine kinase [Isoptericola dokdonensis]ANC29888.1 Redox sensor histidine kinase response regulator DevS [Isoptericola dokdonensis DS-3]
MERTSAEVQDAILHAVHGLTSDVDLRDLLVGVVRAACDLSGARYGALGVIGGSRRHLVEFVTEGIDDEGRARIGHLPTGRGLLGHLIVHQEALRLEDLTTHASAAGFPPGHPPMTTFLGVPVRVRGRVFGNLYLTDKTTGRAFTAADEDAVTALAGVAGLAIDHARLLLSAERRALWLEATAAIPTAVLRAASTDDALDVVLRECLRASGGLTAMAIAPGPDAPGTFTVRTAVGDLGRDPERTLADLRPAVLLAMASSETRWADLPGAGGAVMTRLSIDTLTRGALVIVLRRRAYAEHLAEDSDLVASFAGQASLLLERRHTRAMQQEIAVLAERNRIARDLHDGVTQRLFALGLQLTAAERRAPPDVQELLHTMAKDLDDTIREVRRAVVHLRPSDRQQHSLRAKVQALVAEYTHVLDRSPALRIDGPVDILVDPALHHHVVAVLREALSNAARHAAATGVQVEVVATVDELTCTVADDGVGFDPAAARSGLLNLAERAAELGGALTISSRDPHGSEIVWRVPLPGGGTEPPREG